MRYTLEKFNEFRDACHNASRDAGWWKGSQRYTETGSALSGGFDPDRLAVPTKLCLIHSEISEMSRGYRSGAMDEHLPNLPGALVEGGDVIIRIGDLAGYLEIDLASAIALLQQADHITLGPLGWLHWGEDAPYIGPSGWFDLLHTFASFAMEGFRKSAPDHIIPSRTALEINLARIVIVIDLIAQRNDWDLPAAAEAKMNYNAVRLDHKAEVRDAEGGKQF